MPALSSHRRDWGRIAPTLLILAIAAATTLVVFPPMFYTGKRYDNERSFLRNYRAPNEYEAYTSYCINYAINSQDDNDVVFVGDSSLRFDLRTSQFEEETKLKAYNLGSVGLIALSGYTRTLDAYLSNHPKPRLVVLCILPTALNLGIDKYRPQEERDIKARFLWCFGPGTEETRPHDSFLYHVRQGFRYTYGQLVGGFDGFATEPIPFKGGRTYLGLQQAMTKSRGFSADPERQTILKDRDTSSVLDPFTITDAFKKEFSEFIQLAANHGIPLLIRLTPYSGDAAEHSPTLRAWAEDLESKNPNVIAARPEVLLYDPGLFFDEGHLAAKGAEKFTTLVAAEVKKVLTKSSDKTSTPPPQAFTTNR